MVKLRYKIGLGVIILGSAFLYGRCSRIGPSPVIPNVLPVNDAALITVNPSHHTITVVNQTGTHTTFLPNSPTVIDIGHDGAVSLKSKQFGLEREAFGGIGYADQLRLVGGVDLLYFHRFDFGFGLTVPVTNSLPLYKVRAMVGVSYNVFGNTRLTLGLDNQQSVNGFITVRF